MNAKITWEETIKHIRTQPEYQFLVEKAYFEEELPLNVERFRKSEEFLETLKLLKQFAPSAKTILDIGSGNGISAISLALEGYELVTIEPDPSETIGAGAIRKLKAHYKLSNIEIHEAFAEELNLSTDSFDVVYARQCMHHAYNLDKFVFEMARVLKQGGLFITIRDHVIYNENDKQWFLNNHPLQKFYGGENAFTSAEYISAIGKAGLNLIKEIKYFDSIINYFPLSKYDIDNKYELQKVNALAHLKSKLGILSNLVFVQNLYLKRLKISRNNACNDKNIPGRMYSYLALKQ